MWKKIWVWIKKYAHLLLAGVGTVAGFVLGISLGRNNPDFEQLRADRDKLDEQVRQLRNQVEQLIKLNKLSEQERERLAEELRNAEVLVDDAKQYLGDTRTDIYSLQQANSQLRDWILKYGKELEAIQGSR